MEIKRLWRLALEIFKTVNNLNPYYMKEIFSKTTNLTHRPLDINFNQNTTNYGSYSLQSLGPHVWNSLPSKMKKETDYKKFKNYTNDWFSLKSICNMCSFLNVWTMLSSFDYNLRYDPFYYVTVLLYVVVLFVLYILTTYSCKFWF